MITVDKHDSITLKIAHALSKNKVSSLDIYLFIPGELNFSADIMSDTEFYHNIISQKRAYYSDTNLLPLVHSRLATRGLLSNSQYRVSLSLFAYQYVIALDKAISRLYANEAESTSDEETNTEDDIDSVIELALDILKRLRRSIPYDETMKLHYTNIDNYLSWYTEQKFLSLAAHLPRDTEYKTLKDRLITLADKEEAHRSLNHYNSVKAEHDMTRLSNKMRLLRRLIEHPVVLNEELTVLGNNIQRAVKGLATGLIMLFVTILVVTARDYWGEITASFILVMSLIYAVREIFKDDLKSILWNWLRRGKPKWKRRYFDPTTGNQVGSKLEWLDYKSVSKLHEKIKKIRKKRLASREEIVVHYRAETVMTTSKFMSGYDETRETLHFDFRQITRLFNKNSSHMYVVNNGQVNLEKVEKRHLFNLIIRENNKGEPSNYYRWKVVLNRSKIVDIEPIDIKL